MILAADQQWWDDLNFGESLLGITIAVCITIIVYKVMFGRD